MSEGTPFASPVSSGAEAEVALPAPLSARSAVTGGTRYDAGGDAIATTLPTILYSYDVAGNLLSETDPNGMITAYTYNDLNELTDELVTQDIDQGTGVQHVDVFQAQYTLNDDGSRATETDTRYTPGATVIDNQTKLTWTYDNDQRLVEEQLTVLSGTDGPTPYDDQFGYDLDNNRTQEDINQGEWTAGGSTIYYSYNGDDQLTYEHDQQYAEAGYDLSNTSFTYDASGNQISQVYHHANYGVTYNTDSTTTYTYTLRNQMSSLTTTTTITDTSGADNPQTTTSKTTNYTYDTNGTLASETNYVGTTSLGVANAVTVYYLNDPNNPTGYTKAIQQSTTAGGSPTLSYVIGNRVLAQVNNSGTVSYLLVDGHYNTRALVSSSGVVTATYNYDAFGDAIGFNPSTAATTILFQQTVYDPASGLNFFGDGVREQRPGEDSFIESDDPGYGNNQNPITLNSYLLDNANSVMYHDPNGHDGIADVLVAMGITSVLGGLTNGAISGAFSGNFADGFARGFTSTFITTGLIAAEVAFPPLAILANPFVSNFLGSLGGNLFVDWYEGNLSGNVNHIKFTILKDVTESAVGGIGAQAIDLTDFGEEFFQTIANTLQESRFATAAEYVIGSVIAKILPKNIGSTIAFQTKVTALIAGKNALDSIASNISRQTTIFALSGASLNLISGIFDGVVNLYNTDQ